MGRVVTRDGGDDERRSAGAPGRSDEGWVGRTTTVGANIAVVLLISDENGRGAATVEGTREQGIVTGERVAGSLSPLLDLDYLSKQAELKPGQKVYTSGVGGVFPSGLFVGTIKSSQTRALDSQAKLSPAVDLAKLEDVFVVIGRK